MQLESAINNTELKNYLKEKRSHTIAGGEQYVFAFPNNYGASVIRHQYSYGSQYGLWELAVLDKNGDLCYDTEVTNDVMGNLTEEKVLDVLFHIYSLKL